MKNILLILSCAFLYSCTITGQITKKQINNFLTDSTVRTGHAGISIYEPATGKYLYNYNEEKNFTPSSNVKLFTLYAGMKYLGDSLVGMRFLEDSTDIILLPTGDPTLLHRDFKSQPVIEYLSEKKKTIWSTEGKFKANPFGSGWAWDDYQDYYMVERTAMPVYGNVVSFSGTKNNIVQSPIIAINNLKNNTYSNNGATGFISSVERKFNSNDYTLHIDGDKNEMILVPFITSGDLSAKLLADSIYKKIIPPNNVMPEGLCAKANKNLIYSRPTDSLFRPMMYNSDNFFAEQTLLMVSNEKLGYMSDADIIDTLLKTDLKDMPTKPRWVDGSGLSRYNLFSPKDFIFMLDKLHTEFGIDRMKRILPTGGQGTLKAYYKDATGYIFAKTGSMSNNVSLSGYLFTKKNKMLIFSVQINSFSGAERSGRRAIEKLLLQIRENN
jgi:D-alanyl-D-alanine carboxypeptidase/D-alanyl-D-alanine-endopeptidase (penicillin-binding protein 4)